jgi:hypothetical protein
MTPFLQYDIARQMASDRVRSSATAREIRRARRARRRSRAPVAMVVGLPQRTPGTWVVERAAS